MRRDATIGLQRFAPIIRLISAIVLLSVGASALASGAAAQDAGPTTTVEKLHAALLDVMRRADALGTNGRYQALAAPVLEAYNVPIMAQAAVGRRWKNFTPEQRERFVDAFSRMTLVTYAVRFDDYEGERFESLSERSTGRSIVVRTRIVKADGDTIRLDYLLRQYDGRWQIIDVLAKGSYSELATRRSEYVSVLKREGFEGLIRKIGNKVAELVRKEG